MENNYELPKIWEAALFYIKEELNRVMWNIHQKKYSSPFENTGESFESEVFSVHAYSWNEDIDQEYNFRWRDIEICWEKYLGRGMSANKKLGPNLASTMLKEVLEFLEKYEQDNMD